MLSSASAYLSKRYCATTVFPNSVIARAGQELTHTAVMDDSASVQLYFFRAAADFHMIIVCDPAQFPRKLSQFTFIQIIAGQALHPFPVFGIHIHKTDHTFVGEKSVARNASKYDPASPLLCSHLEAGDRVSQKKVASWKETQLSIFDL